MNASTISPSMYVQPIHFEDFAGKQFERLVFAYHVRSERWITLEWFGQQGKDKGRDIVGRRIVDGRENGETVCVLCANWQKMTLAKIKKDLKKVIASPLGVPERVRVVCGHDVASSIRDDAKEFANAEGVRHCEVWSGEEFEEHLRASTESLLLRFVNGEAFPDAAKELHGFAANAVPLNDTEALAQLARVFDRPAFYTPIAGESSLPAFKQAITDTIKTIGTGIWQTRDGELIARLRARHHFDDSATRSGLARVEKALVALREGFDRQLQAKQVLHCDCKVPECPVYFFKPGAAVVLEALRTAVLESFKSVYPPFDLDALRNPA